MAAVGLVSAGRYLGPSPLPDVPCRAGAVTSRHGGVYRQSPIQRVDPPATRGTVMTANPYTRFAQQVEERTAKARVPTHAYIELTHRCPLACSHCYNNLSMGDPSARSRELSAAEHCRLLDE